MNPSIPLNSKFSVLVVDDHPNTAETMARTIKLLGPGIEVISATDGISALNQIGERGVDLLITDWMMPDMNGLELIEKIRTHPTGKPAFTILMTAYDVPGLKESARRLKVNETIIKPFPPERILKLVGKALEDIRQSRPAQLEFGASKPFKILIADDVQDNVTLLSRYLQNDGYNYISASTGVETLEKTRAELPDLILLDINMPERDGFDVLREIRSDPAINHIAVIILTAARPTSNDMQIGLNLGADDYVIKPFDRRELMARIRTKLRARESEQSIRQRNKMLSILPEIGREFSARKDLDELTEVILRCTVETLGAGFGHIFILNPTGAIHKDYRISLSAPTLQEKQLPPLANLLDQLKDPHQSFIVQDAHTDPFWRDLSGDSIRSVLLVPLLGRFNMIGLLVLIHEKAGYFNVDHQLLLQAIASQAAIAVESALIFSSLSPASNIN